MIPWPRTGGGRHVKLRVSFHAMTVQVNVGMAMGGPLRAQLASSPCRALRSCPLGRRFPGRRAQKRFPRGLIELAHIIQRAGIALSHGIDSNAHDLIKPINLWKSIVAESHSQNTKREYRRGRKRTFNTNRMTRRRLNGTQHRMFSQEKTLRVPINVVWSTT